MSRRVLCFFTLLAVVAGPASAMYCWGPDLHDARLLDARTLQVQGFGCTARTTDWGQTWTAAPNEGRGSSTGHVFIERVFRGEPGGELQNLVVSDDLFLVIERQPGGAHWSIRKAGLLMAVRGNSAFIYQGSLHMQPAGRGWLLAEGRVTEESADQDADTSRGRHAAFQLRFTPGAMCLWASPDGGDGGPCVPAWQGADQTPVALTGFTVAPAQTDSDLDDEMPARDVVVSTPESLWRWEGATRRWTRLASPPDWVGCNGPIPMPVPMPPARPTTPP